MPLPSNDELRAKVLPRLTQELRLLPLGPLEADRARPLEPLARTLRELGFEDGSAFFTQMGPRRVLLRLFGKSEDGTRAAVYHMPEVGKTWVDFVVWRPDGTSATYSNVQRQVVLDPLPRHPARYFPGASVAELYTRFLADRPPGPYVRVPAEGLAGAFERAIAELARERQAAGLSDAELNRAKRGWLWAQAPKLAACALLILAMSGYFNYRMWRLYHPRAITALKEALHRDPRLAGVALHMSPNRAGTLILVRMDGTHSTKEAEASLEALRAANRRVGPYRLVIDIRGTGLSAPLKAREEGRSPEE